LESDLAVEAKTHLGVLFFQFLVVLEEALHLEHDVGGALLERAIIGKGGAVAGAGDELVVDAFRVGEAEAAYCASPYDRQRSHRLLHEDENVERTTIGCVRTGNEAVVRRVMKGPVEDAVEAQ